MLELSASDRGGFHVVRLAGELTAVDAGRLENTIGELGVGEAGHMALELSELKSIDSSGLSALIHLVTRARLTRGRVVLVAPSAFVSGILNVTRLDRWFDVCGTLSDAERWMRDA